MRSTARILSLITSALAAASLSVAMAAGPREIIHPAFSNPLPNVPGKVMIAVVVDYPPGGTTPSHTHPKSAFITGYVLAGAIRSQVDDGPVKIYKAGESWTEQPGAHHRVSENASKTKAAKLLAIFVVDANDTNLLTLDPQQ